MKTRLLIALILAGLLAGCNLFGNGDDDGTGTPWEEKSALQLKGIEEPTLSVLFSADGTRIISGWDNDTTGVWDATTGELLAKYPLRAEYLSRTTDPAVIVAHDGSALHFVRYETGEVTKTIPDIGRAFSYDPASGLVAIVVEGAMISDTTNRVEVRNTITGELVSSFEQPRVAYYDKYLPTITGIALQPGGDIVVTGFNESIHTNWPQHNTIHIWDAATGATRVVIDSAYTARCEFLHFFSPDGTQLLTRGRGADLLSWNTSTWETTWDDDYPYNLTTIAFTPNGQQIITASDYVLYRCSALSGEWIATLGENRGEIGTIDVSPDGKYAVTGSIAPSYRYRLSTFPVPYTDWYLRVWNLSP